MSENNAIEAAWNAYHGPIDCGDGEDYIPAPPPAYVRGWQDGRKELESENARLREALTRLRDCDWTITLPDRMDAVRDIARKSLSP